MARTLEKLDADVVTLEGRVNQLDGAGLDDVSSATVAELAKRINGLKSIVNQVTLLLEQELTKLQAAVANLANTLNTHVGSS